MALTVSNVTGGYTQIPVLHQISFNVKSGELVGLIGLNGAGKSTTINHIIGLLTPFSGTIRVNGISIDDDSQKYKQQIAYVPETPILYPELTLKEHLAITIMAYHLNPKIAWRRARTLLKRFRLANKLNWFPIDFSKGMKQKVMITCAFLTNAKLFIIDEPFLGLDPLAVHDLLNLINERKRSGSSILMTTHVLDTAAKVCDRFVLIHQGHIRTEGTLAELEQEYHQDSLTNVYLSLAKGARKWSSCLENGSVII